MWIVALALRRPYTFTVFAIRILIAGVVAIGAIGAVPQIMATVATISRSTTSPVVDHYDIRPVISIYGNSHQFADEADKPESAKS